MIEEIKARLEPLDERTETLITRRLDGELTGEDESLELDKQLIRSPAARQAFEDSRRIDELAGEMLRGLLGGVTPETHADHEERPAQRPAATIFDGSTFNGSTFDASTFDTITTKGKTRRSLRRFLDSAIGVAAAVLLLMVGTSVLSPDRVEPGSPGLHSPSRSVTDAAIPEMAALPEVASATDLRPSPPSLLNRSPKPALTTVIAGPRRLQEHVDQEVIGIVDPETQSILLLEMQTARSTISRMRVNY